MTPLTKKIIRRSEETVREAGKFRRIVITLYPSGVIGLRPEKTRQEETLSLQAAYSIAVKLRVAAERHDRSKRRGRR